MYMVWDLVFKLFALILHQFSHVVDGSFHCILLAHKLMDTVSKGNVYKLGSCGVYKLPLRFNALSAGSGDGLERC
jgi:hypothetical protein